MITYAFITPIDGIVNFTVSPSDTTMYKDGSIADGLLVKILPDSITSSEAIANKRWNGFAFVDMPEKPNDFYEWEVIKHLEQHETATYLLVIGRK
jgi:hypothetical protein